MDSPFACRYPPLHLSAGTAVVGLGCTPTLRDQEGRGLLPSAYWCACGSLGQGALVCMYVWMDLQFWSPSRAQPCPARETELVPAIKDTGFPAGGPGTVPHWQTVVQVSSFRTQLPGQAVDYFCWMTCVSPLYDEVGGVQPSRGYRWRGWVQCPGRIMSCRGRGMHTRHAASWAYATAQARTCRMHPKSTSSHARPLAQPVAR